MTSPLATVLEQKGSGLLLDNQRLCKHRKTLQKTLITTPALIIIAVFYPLMKLELIKFENEIIHHGIIVFAIISLASSVMVWIKIKHIKNKVSSIDLAFLFSYKAYMALEAYSDSSQFKSRLKNLEYAIENINRLSYRVSLGWKTFIKYNDILPNFDINMNTFVNSLTGLKIALKKETHKPIKIQVALIELMEFFNNNNNNFKKINKELAEYNFLNQTTSIKQKIKEIMMNGKNLKHIVMISFLLLISIFPTIIIILIDPSFIANAITISGIFTVVLVGSYVAPLLKKLAISE